MNRASRLGAAAVIAGALSLALSGVVAAATRTKPDAVLAMSPPLTLGLAGWMTARLRGAPFVFNIQDVFPDVAVELGMITNTVSGSAVWAAAAASTRSSDWENPTLPAYITTVFPVRPYSVR